MCHLAAAQRPRESPTTWRTSETGFSSKLMCFGFSNDPTRYSQSTVKENAVEVSYLGRAYPSANSVSGSAPNRLNRAIPSSVMSQQCPSTRVGAAVRESDMTVTAAVSVTTCTMQRSSDTHSCDVHFQVTP